MVNRFSLAQCNDDESNTENSTLMVSPNWVKVKGSFVWILPGALILKYPPSPAQLMSDGDDGEDANCAEEQWIWLGVCFSLAWCWSFLAQSCLPNDTTLRWAFLHFSTWQITNINTLDVHYSLKDLGNSFNTTIMIKMIIAPKMENFLSGYCSEQSC